MPEASLLGRLPTEGVEAVVGSGQAEGGVSSVVGTVLMLAVTIAVFGGLSVVVLAEIRSTESPPEADLAFVNDGTRAILTHRGGEPIPLEGSFLLLNVDGSEVRLEMTDAAIASQTADGKAWRIGETLCLSGSSPSAAGRTCLFEAQTILGVAVIAGGGLLADEGLRAADVVVQVTYVSGSTTTKGTVGPLAAAQDGADGSAATTITEGSTFTPAGTGGPTKFNGATTATNPTNGATSAGSVLASDDVHATMDGDGDYIEVTGIDLPSNVASITSVTLGYEGRKTGSGSNPTTSLDYKVGSGTYNLGASITESQTGTDVDRTRPLCATQVDCTSGSFTAANLEAMTVRVFHVTDTTPNVLVDHVFVTVAYTTVASTTYSLDVELQFAGSDDGSSETLQLRYQTSGDTFRVQVWDDDVGPSGAFVNRGTLSSAGAFATFTYQLQTAGEFSGGTPRIRLVDLAPTGTSAGSLQLDYARVVTR